MGSGGVGMIKRGRPARVTAGCAAILLAVLGAGTGQGALGARAVPYWASISAAQARARTGPGRQFPIAWLYQRQDLPVKVIEVMQGWRRIQDPDGATGWVMVNLLSETRTAIVTGGEAALRAAPDAQARIVWRAEPGVVGRITKCEDGWCRLDVHGRNGFVDTGHLWGVDSGEEVK